MGGQPSISGCDTRETNRPNSRSISNCGTGCTRRRRARGRRRRSRPCSGWRNRPRPRPTTCRYSRPCRIVPRRPRQRDTPRGPRRRQSAVRARHPVKNFALSRTLSRILAEPRAVLSTPGVFVDFPPPMGYGFAAFFRAFPVAGGGVARACRPALPGGDGNVPEMKLFAGNANPVLAREICAYLGVELGAAEVGRFSDGEIMVHITREHPRPRRLRRPVDLPPGQRQPHGAADHDRRRCAAHRPTASPP